MNDILQQVPLSDEVAADYRLLREGCGLLTHSGLRAVELTGEDRKGWLQGQVTADLRTFQAGASQCFCLCTATGQLEGFGTLWSLDNRFVAIADDASIVALLTRVERMVILEDVQARRLDGLIVSVEGPTATRVLAPLVALPLLDAREADLMGQPVPCLRMNRTGFGGWAFVVQPDLADCLARSVPSVSAASAEIARIEHGLPLFGVDADLRTLPPELGPSFEAANVSYSKGCYLGQEVLMRMHTRGHTNRTWMGIIADGPMARGDNISHASRADAGVITSACESPEFGFIGAAFVRREAAFGGESVVVKTSTGEHDAELQPMPLLRLG